MNEDEYIRLLKMGMQEEPPALSLQRAARFAQAPLLVIDEFCAARYKDGADGYIAGEMQSLLEERYRKRLATLYTTNASLEMVAAAFKAGIGSRIAETCVVVEVLARDHRKGLGSTTADLSTIYNGGGRA